jgi:Arc/MetJ-type ribon-helix-helix transcriptional regulator
MKELTLQQQIARERNKLVGIHNEISILELIERGYFKTKKEVIATALKLLIRSIAKVESEEYDEYIDRTEEEKEREQEFWDYCEENGEPKNEFNDKRWIIEKVRRK